MSQEHNAPCNSPFETAPVIDHIPAVNPCGYWKCLSTKARPSRCPWCGNVPSKKMETKDIIKVEDQDKPKRAQPPCPCGSGTRCHHSCLPAWRKLNIELGEEIVNVVRCTFSSCIAASMREPLAAGEIVLRSPLSCVVTIVAAPKTWMNWPTISSSPTPSGSRMS